MMQKKRAKAKPVAAANSPGRVKKGKIPKALRMPFGTATLVLTLSITIMYFALSNGAAYPPVRMITAGSLSAENLPFGAVTYLFDHAGLGHLIENLAGLVIFCLVAEAALSYRDGLAIFFLSGVVGGLACLAAEPQVKIIGASAGIVGLAVAGVLSDPKRGVLALAFAALLVNFAAPAAADWAAAESYKSLEQQKELAQQKAQELLAQQRPAEAQQQMTVAQEKQALIEQQARTKKSEDAAGPADVAHIVGAIVGAAYVIAFRREVVFSWMKKSRRFLANRMQR